MGWEPRSDSKIGSGCKGGVDAGGRRAGGDFDVYARRQALHGYGDSLQALGGPAKLLLRAPLERERQAQQAGVLPWCFPRQPTSSRSPALQVFSAGDITSPVRAEAEDVSYLVVHRAPAAPGLIAALHQTRRSLMPLGWAADQLSSVICTVVPSAPSEYPVPTPGRRLAPRAMPSLSFFTFIAGAVW